MSIVTVAVFGLGGLVAGATGVALYVGLASATENTRDLLRVRAELLVDDLERRIDAQLAPVVAQARWIADLVAGGAIDPNDERGLDATILGALAASPQVAGIALVTPDGRSRRWGRESGAAITEDWSARPEIQEWLRAGRRDGRPGWRRPFWTPTLGTTVVLHDHPLRRDGRFLGMLGQVVPVAGISRHLADVRDSTDLTPFILFDRDRVLAHPLLIDLPAAASGADSPLPGLDEFADAVLSRIWTPDEPDPYFLRGLERSEASVARVGERYHVFVYRDVATFGPGLWTVGAHLDAERYGGEVRRLQAALGAGLAVLAVSALVAVYAGHRLSQPIRAIASAAGRVREGALDDVPQLPPSRMRELDEATSSFNHMVEGLRERRLVRETLGRFVPEEVARTLLSDGGELAPMRREATVLFCDLAGFTALTEALGPEGIVELLNAYFETMVAILERHGGVVTQFQGDAILATFNVPIADPAHATNALRAAAEMQAVVRSREFAGRRLRQRIGVSTGRLVAGAVGAKGRLSYTVHGDAVNLAARLEALNKTHGTEVLVSGETAKTAEGFTLRRLGETSIRGRTEPTVVYELVT